MHLAFTLFYDGSPTISSLSRSANVFRMNENDKTELTFAAFNPVVHKIERDTNEYGVGTRQVEDHESVPPQVND